MTQKLPKAFTEARSPLIARLAPEPVPNKVEARINMSAEVAGAGLCPECQQPMIASHANGIPVMVCTRHRIAIPTADAAE